MSKTPAQIWEEAKQAALAAAESQNSKLGPEAARGLDCGFAWITIKPNRGPFVKHLKEIGVGRSGSHSGGPGYGIWYSQFSASTQSVSVHEAAAHAAVHVLKENGINAHWSSRLD